MNKYTMTAAQVALAKTAIEACVKADAIAVKAWKKNVPLSFTPEVIANPAAYTVVYNFWKQELVETHKYKVQSVAKVLGRMLDEANIARPGKNAGAANGQSKKAEALKLEISGVVGQGLDSVVKAIRAALEANDKGKAHKLIDAYIDSKAAKAETVAA